MEISQTSSSIAFFGPSGSGKTSALVAFYWKMETDPTITQRYDVTFKIEQADFDSYEPQIQPPNPNEAPVIDIVEIESGGLSKHKVSHKIRFNDDQGRLFATAAEPNVTNIKMLLLKDRETKIAWKLLENSHSIIAMLDPVRLITGDQPHPAQLGHVAPVITNSPERSAYDTPSSNLYGDDDEQERDTSAVSSRHTQQNNQNYYTQSQYARMISRIGWLDPNTIITSSSQQKEMVIPRRIAICLSKCDDPVVGDLVKHTNPDVIVDLLFGSIMTRAINSLREHFGEENVKTFVISSLGYNPATNKPNINPQTGWLINPEHWDPYRVEEPFIWVLNQIERDFSKLQIKDPPQKKRRWFQSIFGS